MITVNISELGDTKQVRLMDDGSIYPPPVDDGLEKLAIALLTMDQDGGAHIGRCNDIFNTALVVPQGSCGTNIHTARVDDLSIEDLQNQYMQVFCYLQEMHLTKETRDERRND